MSDHNVNVDAATVANVVSEVINALGLQRGSTNSGASETSTSDTSGRASTRNRPNTSHNAPITPSILGKRRRRNVAAKPSKIVMWDREVVCLPKSYMDLFNCDGVLPIPRKKKDILVSFGLVGKLHLESDWSPADVVSEIKTTFSDIMKNDDFKFLQFTGTGTKSLMIPKVSASYQWTPKEVAGRADRPIYLLLQTDLDNENEIRCRLSGNKSTMACNNNNSNDLWEPSPPLCVSHHQPLVGESSGDHLHSQQQEFSNSGEDRQASNGSSDYRDNTLLFEGTSHTHLSREEHGMNTHYNFINLLSDSSDEDDLETQKAIQASFQDEVQAREDSNLTMSEILIEHFKQYPSFQSIDEDNTVFNSVHVRRNHIWRDAFRAITKPSFNPTNPVRVTFVGEPAVDEGGPRREFFIIALATMVEDVTMFHGPPYSKYFVHNVQGVRNRLFYFAGLFVAISLANGGPGLHCLSETVYSYMCHGLHLKRLPCKVDDIPDETIKASMLKVINIKESSDLQDLLMENDIEFKFIKECGFLKQPHKITLDDVCEITETVCVEYLIHRNVAEIQQFMDGLDVLGIGALLKSYPECFKEMFIHTPKVVTAHDLDKLFIPQFSPHGSNIREKEEAIVLNWKDHIYEAEECGVTPSQILAFVTGAVQVPPMGFPLRPSITFLPDDGSQCHPLPTASTCSLTLRLPLVLENYGEFRDKMTMAVLNTVGFGYV